MEIRRGIVAWVLGVALVLVAGGFGGERPVQASCQEGCYSAKSVAYQKCRQIPPTDRAARNACFHRADSALQRCLSRCK